MVVLAKILNAALLVFMLYVLVTGEWAGSGADLLLALLFLGYPVVNWIAIHQTQGETWLDLYFKRKAAEERQRIKEIEARSNDD